MLRIGARLGFSFAATGLLMVLGGVVAFWQLEVTRRQADQIFRANLLAQAVLRAHGDVLNFRERLEELATPGTSARFVAEARERREAFEQDVERATRALAASPAGSRGRSPTLLESVRIGLPAQVDAMTELARAEDWAAVRHRLQSQVRQLGRLTASVVEEIDAQVATEQANSLAEIRRVRGWALRTLSATALLTLLTAAVLGRAVTRSITGPLARLNDGAGALARGEFAHQVAVRGSDELASLGRAFNETARRLRSLYEALHHSEAHFRSLIDNASDLIMVLGTDGRILYASPSCERIAGHDPGALVGRSLFELAHPDDAPRVSGAIVRPAGASGAAAPFEFRLRHADGSLRVLEAVANPLLDDPASPAVVVNSRDVTERKQAEAAEAELRVALRRSETMSAMGMLVAGVAHEVRNPLFGISASLDAIEAKGERAGSDLGPLIGSMRTEVDRLVRLMQGLLDYGKPPSPTLRPEPIHTVVADAAAVCAALAGERNVKLTDGIPSSFPPVRMDRKRLAQVFENLLQNAIQHSPRGGMVAVEGALEEEEAAASLVLTVTDSGPGFAREDLPHVFEPFFSRRRGGTGLGLAIVQRIVEEHGGIIRAANRPGGGAAVTVRLPVADH